MCLISGWESQARAPVPFKGEGGGVPGPPAGGKFSKNEAKSCILSKKGGGGFRAPRNPYGARTWENEESTVNV